MRNKVIQTRDDPKEVPDEKHQSPPPVPTVMSEEEKAMAKPKRRNG